MAGIILNPDEIDRMIQQADREAGNKSERNSEAFPEKTPPGKRLFYQETKNQRFQFEYHSPVIKERRVVLNPSPDSPEPRGKTIVRNLENYVKYRRSKNSH